jgi:hypothetical protein
MELMRRESTLFGRDSIVCSGDRGQCRSLRFLRLGNADKLRLWNSWAPRSTIPAGPWSRVRERQRLVHYLRSAIFISNSRMDAPILVGMGMCNGVRMGCPAACRGPPPPQRPEPPDGQTSDGYAQCPERAEANEDIGRQRAQACARTPLSGGYFCRWTVANRAGTC